jgi:histidinol-phosphate aminotransferase
VKNPEPCPWVAGIPAYVPGRSKEEIARAYGVRPPIVKLASNENPLGPSPRALEAMREAMRESHLYPDPEAGSLREAAAGFLGCPPANVIAGNGSDEIIDLVCRAYLRPGDSVVIPECTFSYYTIAAKACGAVIRPARMRGHAIDPDDIAAKAVPGTRMVFVANPNNPTGSCMGKDEVMGLVRGIPADCLLLMDEAYAAFVRREDFMGCARLAPQIPNLVCVHTLSKSHGLAGLRVGFAVSSRGVTETLLRIRPPFNVNVMAQKAGAAALVDHEFLRRTLKTTWDAIDRLQEVFSELGIGYEPSQANFVMARIGPDARRIYEGLLRKGIITRFMDSFGLSEHIRVSAGTPEEIGAFIEALREVL